MQRGAVLQHPSRLLPLGVLVGRGLMSETTRGPQAPQPLILMDSEGCHLHREAFRMMMMRRRKQQLSRIHRSNVRFLNLDFDPALCLSTMSLILRKCWHACLLLAIVSSGLLFGVTEI
jgi:hypothetical protein